MRDSENFTKRLELGISLIEKFQAKTTKIPNSMGYEAKLEKWEFYRLKYKRMRGDLIEKNKSVNELDEINWKGIRS